MQKQPILQNGIMPPSLEACLAESFEVHELHREADPAAFLARRGGEFTGLVTRGGFGADAAMIDAMPSLRVIANFGVGYEKVDLAAAKRRNIQVCNTPDILTDCVADLAFGLLIDTARRMTDSDRYLRRGDWKAGMYPLTHCVHHKRLGILGLGRIGGAIAARSAGFNMEVRYHNRRPAANVSYGYEPSLVELARWSDFLVIAAVGGPETHRLVDAAVLDALGPEGYLINIARGTIVDESALVDALAAKRIAGAGLDVFDKEPNVPPALLAMDNVVLLPHVASATHETRRAMGDVVLRNLQTFYAEGRLVTPVT
jgi:hydroxypyruvate reductase